MVGTGILNILQLRSAFRSQERQHDRDDRKDAISEADRFRTLYLAELDRSIMWERRCRFMDDRAHELRHQINDERQRYSGLLERAGIKPPEWPDNPPLPKLEDI